MTVALPALSILLAALAPAAAQSLALSDRWTAEYARGVAAARLDSPYDDPDRYPGAVRVITPEDIRRSSARTLQELLRAVPGATLYDQTGDAFQQTADLRGFNGQPVPAMVVLLDGARVNESDFGQVNYQLIPLQDVERVEIMPGPQTLLGKDALSGVINIVTKRGSRAFSAWGEAAAGSYGARRLSAGASGPLGGRAAGLRYRASAQRQTETGWRSHSAARVHAASGRLDYADAAGVARASLRYRFADDDLRQAGALTASELGRDRRQNVSRVEMDSLLHMVSGDARRALGAGWALSAEGSARRRLENTPLNLGRTSVSRSRSAMTRAQGALQLENASTLLARRSFFAAGAEAGVSRTDADSSGSFGTTPFVSGSVVGDRALGVFAQESFDLVPGRLTLTAGVRADRDSIERHDKATPANDGGRVFRHVSPRVGLNASLADGVGAYASLSEAFRSPTADELSALGPFSQAPLQPVKTRGAELGLRAGGGWGEASAAVYRSLTRDEIYAVFDPTAGFGQNRNVELVRRQGVELSARPRFAAWEASLGYSYTEAAFQTGFTLDKAPFPATQVVRPGDFVPQVPRHRLALGASVRPAAGWELAAEEVCVSSQYLFGDESNTEPRLGGYCLLGLSASLERGAARFFLKVDNALDKRYESRGILGKNPATGGLDRFLTPAPGIRVEGGVRVRLGTSPRPA